MCVQTEIDMYACKYMCIYVYMCICVNGQTGFTEISSIGALKRPHTHKHSTNDDNVNRSVLRRRGPHMLSVKVFVGHIGEINKGKHRILAMM